MHWRKSHEFLHGGTIWNPTYFLLSTLKIWVLEHHPVKTHLTLLAKSLKGGGIFMDKQLVLYANHTMTSLFKINLKTFTLDCILILFKHKVQSTGQRRRVCLIQNYHHIDAKRDRRTYCISINLNYTAQED